MININCYGCNKQFSFRQTEEGKSFSCPNCGKNSLVSSKIKTISLPDNIKISREKLANYLTPLELYKIKSDIRKLFFRRLQFSSIAMIILGIFCFLILNKPEETNQSISSSDKPFHQPDLPSTSSLEVLQNGKSQSAQTLKTNIEFTNDKNQNKNTEKFEFGPISLLNRNVTNEIIESNLSTKIGRTESKVTDDILLVNNELNSIEVKPEPKLNKPEFLEFNVLNFTNRKIFIKHKSATNLFLISLDDFPEYIEGDGYSLETSTELFIKVKNENEIKYSLIYYGEKKGHEFLLQYDNLKIIFALGKQMNNETIEYSLLSIETNAIRGILHTLPKAKEIVVNKEETKKNEKLEKNEEKVEREVTKVVKVYNFPSSNQFVYRSYCSDCEHDFAGNHICNSTYLNSFSNFSNRQIQFSINDPSGMYLNNNTLHSYQTHKSYNFSHGFRPIFHHNFGYNSSTSSIRVIKR